MAMAPLTINLIQGSVSCDFTEDAAQELKSDISQLMKTFQVIQGHSTERTRPSAQPNLEYRYTGRSFIECFCNPNIWPTPFAAKVLVTVRDENIRLTTEAELPQLVEDLNSFLDAQG
ncbi:MAG: hypothetical protein HC810_01125 [Acaryochloridaceae cyanobacterium RL_2_7]|nr:hypothetical protein [Acaryochloridaceae cyanobacterium RL_2_7]